jgi:hypothetical protein
MLSPKIACITFLSLSAFAQQIQSQGSIAGRVVDQNNMPVANVVVYALADKGTRIGPQVGAQSDAEGKFLLSGLIPGPNRLFPVSTEQGYPDGRYGIFAGDSSLYKVVEVEADKVVTGVIITMPQKGGTLALSVVDAETKAPVLTSRIRITRPDLAQDRAYYDSSPRLHGPLEIALPRRLPFRLEVRAPGYQTWRYSAVDTDGKESFDLVLEGGGRKSIVVELKKESGTGEKDAKNQL